MMQVAMTDLERAEALMDLQMERVAIERVRERGPQIIDDDPEGNERRRKSWLAQLERGAGEVKRIERSLGLR